jgi:ribosomal protein S27E
MPKIRAKCPHRIEFPIHEMAVLQTAYLVPRRSARVLVILMRCPKCKSAMRVSEKLKHTVYCNVCFQELQYDVKNDS